MCLLRYRHEHLSLDTATLERLRSGVREDLSELRGELDFSLADDTGPAEAVSFVPKVLLQLPL